jgi:hypothetical protein
VTRLDSAAVGYLSIAVVLARVLQSLVHVVLPQTPFVVAVRFTFFFAQIVCFMSLVTMIIAHAAFNP